MKVMIMQSLALKPPKGPNALHELSHYYFVVTITYEMNAILMPSFTGTEILRILLNT